jgi:hypothetical protein
LCRYVPLPTISYGHYVSISQTPSVLFSETEEVPCRS